MGFRKAVPRPDREVERWRVVSIEAISIAPRGKSRLSSGLVENQNHVQESRPMDAFDAGHLDVGSRAGA